MRSLDLNKIKKNYFVLTLNDENKTVLKIGTPTKEVLEDFVALQADLTDENSVDNAINAMYEIVAKILSNNKEKKEITSAELSEMLDYEDLFAIVREYSEFIVDIQNLKN